MSDTELDLMVVRGPRTADVHALARFAPVAVLSGWVLLSLPIVLDQPFEPFVLATLLLGLVVPAVLLTRRDPTTTVRASLLRDCWRLPRPVWLLVPSLLLLPVATWCAAATVGAAMPASGSLISGVVVNVISSLLIVNLWEEMVWTGFVQRRAMRSWGYLRGSVGTAVLFAAIHAPLAVDGAHDAADVAVNAGVLLGSALGLRLLVGALDLRGGGSLLAVGVLHASFNASALVVDPSQDWIRYLVTGLAGVVAGSFVVATTRKASS